MQNKTISRQRPHERGQTMVLVAISLVSLLAMAALAIDIVTLYAARSEIQRAADAAAIAGAKALADSGITTLLLTDANFNTIKTWADTAKNQQIDAVLSNNLVAGQPPSVVSKTVDWSRQGNPHLTVSLQRTGLPTFFSKIWTRSAATVTATATAEVYNPANLTSITPIAPKNVKPWLVANVDPTGTAPTFVDTTLWGVDSGVIGKNFNLVSDCNSLNSTSCSPLFAPPAAWSPAPNQVYYVPAAVNTPSTPNVCPACAGGTDYEQSIECADVATSYQVLSCGGGAANAQWNNTINPGAPPAGNNATSLGGQCLIHASNQGLGQNQDLINNPGIWPAAAVQFKAQSGPQNGNLVTTSNSIVTIPIFDTGTFNPAVNPVTIVGFLQAFINQLDAPPIVSGPPAGSINITVLNIAGCSSTNNGANPVVGASGSSPVPVRLITPP